MVEMMDSLITDDEFLELNIHQELQDKKSREERKANGRYVAVIVACLCIFLAMYHAWIRKAESALAGVLVPLSIMCLYGGWVVFLARREKHRRAMYMKCLQEAARNHILKKLEEGKLKARNVKKTIKEEPTSSPPIILKLEDEHKKLTRKTDAPVSDTKPAQNQSAKKEKKKKRSKPKDAPMLYVLHIPKEFRTNRPSFRKRLLRQYTINAFNGKTPRKPTPPPPLSRTSSAP